jgi:hypothetical protein
MLKPIPDSFSMVGRVVETIYELNYQVSDLELEDNREVT